MYLHSIYFLRSIFAFVFSCFYLLAHSQPADSVEVAKEVDSLIQVSRALTGKREFEKALEVNAVAERLALERFGRESAAYGSCCSNYGRIFYFKGDYPEAEKWFLEVKTIREKALGKEHPDYAWSLSNLAVLYRNMGQYEKAEPLYLEAKAIREKTLGKEHLDYGSSLNNLAVLYSEMGHYKKAEQFFVEAKAIREKALGKEHPDYAWSLNNLASLYKHMGQYERAEPLFIEGIAIKEKVLGKEHSEYASSLYNLANLYQDMGQYERAESLYLEAKAVKEKVLGKEHPDYASCLNSLANLYYGMGNYEKAKLFYIKDIAIKEKVLGKEHPNYASSLTNLANLYHDMGNYEKAEPLYIEGIAIEEKVLGKENPDYASSLYNLANLYFNTGQYEKAELLYFEAIVIREKALGKEHPEYAASLYGLANLYSGMGNYEKAELLYIEAKATWAKALGKEHPDYVAILHSFAGLYSGLDQYEKAEPLYIELSTTNNILIQKALHHLSERELNSYLKKFTNSQDQTISFAKLSGNKKVIPVCYDNSLFYKGFLLNAISQINRSAQTDSIATEKFNLLKSYQRRLAAEHAKPVAERKNVEELEEKANDLEKDLARSVSGYGEAMRQVKWQEVQQALRPGEAAIEFVHYRYYGKKETDSIMYAALLLRPGDEQPLYLPLCEARQLQSHIEEQRQMSINNLYAYPGEGEPSLYQLLWSPLEPYLGGINTIYYSPSGELHRFNLAAIGLPSGEVLGDRFRLQLLMSTRQLVSPAPPPAAEKGKALVFGGIQYDVDSTSIYKANQKLSALAQDTTSGYLAYADRTRGDFKGTWEYLKGTLQEADSIRMTLEAAGFEVTLRRGEEATEEVFKQTGSQFGGSKSASPAILHLATHGYFFPDPAPQLSKGGVGDEPVFKMSEHPLIRSGLIFAGANHAWRTGHPYKGAEDGILTAYEVSQMNLSNTELVVLSACETGLGDIQGNEGVYGLQRAFRIAGAKYLLMSLWKVPDEATRALMTNFYRYWLTDKLAIEDAFRKAQSELRSQNSDPEVWAGFVLIKG